MLPDAMIELDPHTVDADDLGSVRSRPKTDLIGKPMPTAKRDPGERAEK
ncbi:MAG: hypothetical protein IPG10_08980 [Flavobacteriales bacterium]|nr:hypothetical protein [Flavobacteriales bacterium]